MQSCKEKADKLKQQNRIAQQKWKKNDKERVKASKEQNKMLKSIMDIPLEPEPEPVKRGRKKKDKSIFI